MMTADAPAPAVPATPVEDVVYVWPTTPVVSKRTRYVGVCKVCNRTTKRDYKREDQAVFAAASHVEGAHGITVHPTPAPKPKALTRK